MYQTKQIKITDLRSVNCFDILLHKVTKIDYFAGYKARFFNNYDTAEATSIVNMTYNLRYLLSKTHP